MNGVLATYRRELRAYFFSPLAYVVLFCFLLYNGFIFVGLVGNLNDPRSVGGPFFTFFFSSSWVMLLLLPPVLTMHLVSEELRSGSIEVLLTAPVTEGQVIIGKFLSSLTFYAFLWFPTVAYAGMISLYEKVDWGPVASGYLGLLLVGALFISIGLFSSAMSRSQLVAAITTFVIVLLLLLLEIFERLVNLEGLKKALGYLKIIDHIDEFANGIVDTRRLVFYLSGTLFFLFLASRALEDRKWR